MTLAHSERLRQAQSEKQSVLCVGLDPDIGQLPAHLLKDREPVEAVRAFVLDIIEAVHPYASVFKPNIAFFEVFGWRGWQVLEEVIRSIPPDCVIIADAKRADIGNSARFYAETFLDRLGCDAVTVAPYMGRDSVEPFLQFRGKAAYVLARTSNPGARDLQECTVGEEKLYARTARLVSEWSAGTPGGAGLVVGATEIAPLKALRELCPQMPFLIPGVGAQGGNAAEVIQATETRGGQIIVNSSRQILYASSGKDFAEMAARAAEVLRSELYTARTGFKGVPNPS